MQKCQSLYLIMKSQINVCTGQETPSYQPINMSCRRSSGGYCQRVTKWNNTEKQALSCSTRVANLWVKFLFPPRSDLFEKNACSTTNVRNGLDLAKHKWQKVPQWWYNHEKISESGIYFPFLSDIIGLSLTCQVEKLTENCVCLL